MLKHFAKVNIVRFSKLRIKLNKYASAYQKTSAILIERQSCSTDNSRKTISTAQRLHHLRAETGPIAKLAARFALNLRSSSRCSKSNDSAFHHPRLIEGSVGLLSLVAFGLFVAGCVVTEINEGRESLTVPIEEISYTPLDSATENFRLLILLPGAYGRIECTLVPKCLSDNPVYEALSHAWGDSTAVKPIIVNGAKVEIRESLWYALKCLRHTDRERVLWIDSICINQADTSEKNGQVSIMASVFQRAHTVLVWLGIHHPPNDLHEHPFLSLEAFDATQTKIAEEKGSRMIETSDESPNSLEAMIYKMKQAAADAESFLYGLIHEEYWKRAWITQEIVMAQDNLIVCYAAGSTHWEEFMRWVSGYANSHPNDTMVKSILRLNELRLSKRKAGTVLSLVSLLDTFKDAFSTLPHDKIYAFLGLAHDYSLGVFKVDYEKPLSEVYHDMIRYYMVSSALSPTQKSTQLVYFSALVRRLLTRQSLVVRTRRKGLRQFLIHKLSMMDNIIFGLALCMLLSLLLAARERIFPSAHRDMTDWSDTYGANEQRWKLSGREIISDWIPAEDTSKIIGDISIRGLRLGVIERIGPSCPDIKSMISTAIDWRSSQTHKTNVNEDDMETRRLVKKFTVGVDYHDQAQLRNVVSFWTISHANLSKECPKVFIGTDGILGVIPPDALKGDLICHIWNTNSYAIVRPKNTLTWRGYSKRYELVGRAAVLSYGKPVSASSLDLDLDAELYGVVNECAVDVSVSLTNLTRLSLDTVYLPGT